MCICFVVGSATIADSSWTWFVHCVRGLSASPTARSTHAALQEGEAYPCLVWKASENGQPNDDAEQAELWNISIVDVEG